MRSNNETQLTSSRIRRTSLVTIKPPRFAEATFNIAGINGIPLVINRMSAKVKEAIALKARAGQPARSKRAKREVISADDLFNDARYRSKEGWDGVHASCFRNAMISACRLVEYQMTKAKLSIFVIPDGMDATEPQIPLVRLTGEAVLQEDAIRNKNTNGCSITVRAAYHDWKAQPKIRWDADQFTVDDVLNLLARVGMQVGIGCGRPDSKDSPGMGWGLFSIESIDNQMETKI